MASKKAAKKAVKGSVKGSPKAPPAKYPRHSVDKSLRIPRAILEQHAGKACSIKESAKFLGVGDTGPYQVEVSSGIKYGFLDRPSPGQICVTDRAKKILRPQNPEDALEGLREAVLSAPIISEVYSNYRGENLPDPQFFSNALTDSFEVPADKVVEFKEVFLNSLQAAQLISDVEGKKRIIDISHSPGDPGTSSAFKKLGKSVKIDSGETCFVMMPFAPPLGDYYVQVYKPAIERVGLRPIRADNEIFGTGMIMQQILDGIRAAKVLVAELTTRNANVFYELGLAHALEKPVVLISSNEADVPFDLKHIRVIYYDVTDPFWGNKLIDKVAENILSAIDHPDQATLTRQG